MSQNLWCLDVKHGNHGKKMTVMILPDSDDDDMVLDTSAFVACCLW
jgi:hypothetical protein